MNNLRTPAINVSLERTISRDRLTKYLGATADELDASLALYERNTRLSEAMYTPLQSLEVCLRNSVSHEMGLVYGLDWLTNGTAPLAQNALDSITHAQDQFAAPTISDLVAELKFSFWVGLTGPGYDETIWRKAIYKAFQAAGGKKRSLVHGRLNALRRFRNRVAHHEPIFASAGRLHQECLEAIGWMCADTRAWATHHTRFPAVFAAA
ncbi:Abi family protein [Mesorhizobium sp. M0847]|uniref:Abi family protein n=1 Tax=unclassified Mesorhizobium TaxID=325217 RepID=UPI003338DFDC